MMRFHRSELSGAHPTEPAPRRKQSIDASPTLHEASRNGFQTLNDDAEVAYQTLVRSAGGSGRAALRRSRLRDLLALHLEAGLARAGLREGPGTTGQKDQPKHRAST
jgi:hypothetical protein